MLCGGDHVYVFDRWFTISLTQIGVVEFCSPAGGVEVENEVVHVSDPKAAANSLTTMVEEFLRSLPPILGRVPFLYLVPTVGVLCHVPVRFDFKKKKKGEAVVVATETLLSFAQGSPVLSRVLKAQSCVPLLDGSVCIQLDDVPSNVLVELEEELSYSPRGRVFVKNIVREFVRLKIVQRKENVSAAIMAKGKGAASSADIEIAVEKFASRWTNGLKEVEERPVEVMLMPLKNSHQIRSRGDVAVWKNRDNSEKRCLVAGFAFLFEKCVWWKHGKC
jgi:hypothetical protein